MTDISLEETEEPTPLTPAQRIAARDWTFTIFPPNRGMHLDLPAEQAVIVTWPYKYIIYQIEECPHTQREHLQGFVQFTDKQRLTALKKFHPTAHWEKRLGTPYEAQHYCMKPVPDCDCKHCIDCERYDDRIFEDGFMSVENQHRVHEVARVIKKQGLARAIERFPETYLTLHNGMKALDNFYTPVRTEPPFVMVLFGASESGKTRYAIQGPNPYLLPCGGRNQTDFFGDYRPRFHQTLVLDDFYGGWKYTTFLRTCDRYPTEVQTKGGFAQLLTPYIVFTSNVHPFSWYPKVLADPARRHSFDRRINCIVEFFKEFYIVRRGDLPWQIPHLRPATLLETMQNPWNPNPPVRRPQRVDVSPWSGVPSPCTPPPQNPLPPRRSPPPQPVTIHLPPSSPGSQSSSIDWRPMPQPPALIGPMPPAQWEASLIRQRQDELQQEVERSRSAQMGVVEASESFWERRNDWLKRTVRVPPRDAQ